MKAVIINKTKFLLECRATLGLRYGFSDYNDLIDDLCTCIKDHHTDRKAIHELVFCGQLFKNTSVPNNSLCTKLFIFLMDLREEILDLIHQGLITKNKHRVQFVKSDSKLSLSFRIFD